MNKIYTTFIAVLLLPGVSSAYLDPGTGSMLFSALIGVVATLMFVGKSLIFKIRHLPGYLAGKKEKNVHEGRLVFYSEGEKYWNVFKPVLQELNLRGIAVLYISSGENDPGLTAAMEYVSSKYIPEGGKLFFCLNTLDADMVVMTTPGLDVFQIKRSAQVKYYCHITHSAGGCGGYRVYGLDYYDGILVGGSGDEKLIRELEKKRNIEEKDVEIIGCTYLDALRESSQLTRSVIFENDQKTILISPTWGFHGLLTRYGKELLSVLSNSGLYNVIVRPHPQSLKVESELISELTLQFNGSNFYWDTDADNSRALTQSDIMISDFSGIVFDYLLIHGKPVFSFGGDYDKRAKDVMDSESGPWNVNVLNKTGMTLAASDVKNIVSKIEEAFSNNQNNSSILAEVREGMDAYPGESGVLGANFIENKLKELQG